MSYKWAHEGQYILLDFTPSGGEEINLHVTNRAPNDGNIEAPLFFGKEHLQQELEPVLEKELTAFLAGQMRRKDQVQMKEAWEYERQAASAEYEEALKIARRDVSLRKFGASTSIKKTWP